MTQMSARSDRADQSKLSGPAVPEGRRHREGAETETARTDLDAPVLTDARFSGVFEFQPEQPPVPAGGPAGSVSSDSDPLDCFTCEPSSSNETRLRTTNQTIAEVRPAAALPVADTGVDASWPGLGSIGQAPDELLRPGSVVPQVARTPIALDQGRQSSWQWPARLALVTALGAGIGFAGVTIVLHWASVTPQEDASSPPSQSLSSARAAGPLPTTTIVPSSAPTALGEAVDARGLKVPSARDSSVPPPLASPERPTRPTAPSTPASALRDLMPRQAVRPTPLAATSGVAPAAVDEPSPPVARVPAPMVAREPEPSTSAAVGAPLPVTPWATTISPSSAAPPSAAPPSSSAIPARLTDTGAIQAVLSRYRNAFSVLDAGAAKAVWPTVDGKALERAFDQLQQQTLEFDACAITVTDTRAVASCGGNARYVPKVGNKSPRTEVREWRFNLRKVTEEWLIEAVASR